MAVKHGLDAAAPLMLYHVQTAFLFERAGPAPGTVVFTVGDRLSAGPTADAGIAFIMQRIIGNVVLGDKSPDVALGPTEERVDLYQVEFDIPLYDSRRSPLRRLIAPNGADPGLAADERPA